MKEKNLTLEYTLNRPIWRKAGEPLTDVTLENCGRQTDRQKEGSRQNKTRQKEMAKTKVKLHSMSCLIKPSLVKYVGGDSVAGMATCYVLDCPRIESQ